MLTSTNGAARERSVRPVGTSRTTGSAQANDCHPARIGDMKRRRSTSWLGILLVFLGSFVMGVAVGVWVGGQ
jgi:hypothetical protein